MERNLSYLIILVTLTCSFHTTVNAQDSSSILISELNKKIPRLIKRYNGAGLSVALINNGQLSWSEGYGYADKTNKIEASPSTVYQAASISKPVAAWAIMKLAEEGLLDLDAPVSQYLSIWQLPDSEFDNDKVTARRILSHNAGLSLGGFPGFPPDYELPALPEALSGANSSKKRVYVFKEPGIEFDYSGGGYMLLSLLVEELSGKSFEDYIEEEILLPLGMDSSTYYYNKFISGLAKPYKRSGEEIPAYIYCGKGAASLHTTVDDLAILVAALAGSADNKEAGNNILKPATISEMTSPVCPTKGDITFFYDSMALGYFTDYTGIVSHTGSNRGWRSIFGIYPDTGDGIVIMTNSDSGRNIYIEIIRMWSELNNYPQPKMLRFFKKVYLISLAIVLSLLLSWAFLSLRIILQVRKKQRSVVKRSDIMSFRFWGRIAGNILFPSAITYIYVTGISYIMSDLSPLTYKWITAALLLNILTLVFYSISVPHKNI